MEEGISNYLKWIFWKFLQMNDIYQRKLPTAIYTEMALVLVQK